MFNERNILKEDINIEKTDNYNTFGSVFSNG